MSLRKGSRSESAHRVDAGHGGGGVSGLHMWRDLQASLPTLNKLGFRTVIDLYQMADITASQF